MADSERISRREFLQGVGALAGSGILAACGVQPTPLEISKEETLLPSPTLPLSPEPKPEI